jgi:ParB family chromosome partitioning protein
MSKGGAIPFNLPSVDDLFTSQAERDDAKREKVSDIPLDMIDDFPDHPFLVRIDDEMREMVESVREYGVLTPAIARQKDDGRYELVSGHRRKMASELAGLSTLPVIVRDMDRDAAIVFMVNANLQREKILPSEKGRAYRMKMEAMNRQMGRPTKNEATKLPTFQGKKSVAVIGEQVGESHETVRRYIRLTELIPAILQMVDDSRMAFRPAVEISYLPEKEQQDLLEIMEMELATPSLAQAIKLKQFSHEGRLSSDVTLSIMREQKPNQVEQFKMPKDRIDRFFKPGTPAEKIEETIVRALELYRKRERSRDDAR